MTVVADAGPLIYLAGAGQLALLPQLYDRVLMPRVVFDEIVVAGAGLLGARELIGDPESILRWLLPLLNPVAAVVGVISAQVLRSREPAVFAQMGRHRALQLIEDENR